MLNLNLYTKNSRASYISTSTYPVDAVNWIKENLDYKNIKLFNDYNGAITEQYVLQEFKTLGELPVFYWASNRAELDFLIQHKNNIIPVETKATINLQAKSLKSFRQKYEPKISIRTSLADYEENNGLFNIPLYDIENVKEII